MMVTCFHLSVRLLLLIRPLLVCPLVLLVRLLWLSPLVLLLILLRLLPIPLILIPQYSRLQHWLYLSVNCLCAKLLVLITSRPRCSSRSVLTCPSFSRGSSVYAGNGPTFLLSGDTLKYILSSRKVIHHFPQTTVQFH